MTYSALELANCLESHRSDSKTAVLRNSMIDLKGEGGRKGSESRVTLACAEIAVVWVSWHSQFSHGRSKRSSQWGM